MILHHVVWWWWCCQKHDDEHHSSSSYSTIIILAAARSSVLVLATVAGPITKRGELTRVERTRTRPEWLIRVTFECRSPPVHYSFGSSFACCSHAVRVLVQREKLYSHAIRMLVHYSFALIQISFMSHSIAFSVRSGSFVAVHLPEPAIVHSTARFFWELPTSDVGAARFYVHVHTYIHVHLHK